MRHECNTFIRANDGTEVRCGSASAYRRVIDGKEYWLCTRHLPELLMLPSRLYLSKGRVARLRQAVFEWDDTYSHVRWVTPTPSQIHAAIRDIDARSQLALVRRFGLDGSKPDTWKRVGQVLGVTRERASQITNKALKKLRFRLMEESFNG